MSLKLSIQKNITQPKETINQQHNKYAFHFNLTNKKPINTKFLTYNYDTGYSVTPTHSIIFSPYNAHINYYKNCNNC